MTCLLTPISAGETSTLPGLVVVAMIELLIWYLPAKKVGALNLEYDDERFESFECLSKVTEDKKVVLGLITTKNQAEGQGRNYYRDS